MVNSSNRIFVRTYFIRLIWSMKLQSLVRMFKHKKKQILSMYIMNVSNNKYFSKLGKLVLCSKNRKLLISIEN